MLELLLSENRAKQAELEKARLREYLKQLNELIRQEKDLQGRTAGGEATKPLAEQQRKIADRTGGLARDMRRNDEAKDGGPRGRNGKDPQGQPPGGDQPEKRPRDRGDRPAARGQPQPGGGRQPGGDEKPPGAAAGKMGRRAAARAGKKARNRRTILRRTRPANVCRRRASGCKRRKPS